MLQGSTVNAHASPKLTNEIMVKNIKIPSGVRLLLSFRRNLEVEGGLDRVFKECF
jgi:hypothetical protein